MDNKTYYDTLGVARDATAEEIRDAYRAKRSNLHPDREGGDDEAMAELNVANDVLSDPELRASYDAELPNVEREAETTFRTMFDKHCSSALDPIQAMRQDVEAAIVSLDLMRTATHTSIAMLTTHLRRLKFAGTGVNIPEEMFKSKIAAYQKTLHVQEYTGKALQRLREMMDDYGYESRSFAWPEMHSYTLNGIQQWAKLK